MNTTDARSKRLIRNVGRILFICTAVLFLLVELALIFLWVRSYRVVETTEWVKGGRGYSVRWDSGLIMADMVTGIDPKESAFLHHCWPNRGPEWNTFSQWKINRLGFSLFRSPSGRTRGFMVPVWFLMTVAGVVPALGALSVFRRWRRSVATRRGLCPKCGYDLRASRERCPECGTPIVRPPVP